MSNPIARKVNQCVHSARQLLTAPASASSTNGLGALLLLERALIYYCVELNNSYAPKSTALNGALTLEVATATVLETAENNELTALLLTPDSWLACLVRACEEQWIVKKGDGLNSDFFANDLEISTSNAKGKLAAQPQNVIATSSPGHKPVSLDIQTLDYWLNELSAMIARQRAHNEEY